MLSERQQDILRAVVASYLESGHPVSSKAIAGAEGLEWSASTVRNELSALEAGGYLTHPHTSAGRVPTDAGYRLYADTLLAAPPSPVRSDAALDLSRMRREVDEAMRVTTAALSQVTDLVALATAPPASSSHVHRVEVLALQPRVVMVMVIASNGAVTKRVYTFSDAVDPGVVEWASSYLNERLAGLALGARMTGSVLADPGLSVTERAFLDQITSAFTDLEQRAGEDLYVEGATRLLSEEHAPDLPQADSVMRTLEGRAGLLRVLRAALDERSAFVWVGEEDRAPELRFVSIVGANYGLGYRNLGTVGVVGPMRMDYATAISSVREAATELSRFFETVYEG
ncbi:MAG: heat-inducible transcriptional repressor HrcA [Solirubrobacterales bacterium]